MIDYKSIARTYGIKECSYIKFLFLRTVNECIDATSLVYSYLSAVRNKSILKYYYRRRMVRRYNIFIDDHAIIEPGLRLPHPTGIVIGSGVVLKENVTLFQNVTLGSKSINAKQYPIIERGTTVFAGSVIIGAVSIGEGSTIGANSVVNVNVEANTIYAGIPARRIK